MKMSYIGYRASNEVKKELNGMELILLNDELRVLNFEHNNIVNQPYK